MKQEDRPDWVQHKERSHGVILRLMVWVSLTFGRRVGRVVLHGIAAYFVLFAPAARRASRAYLSLALERHAGWGDGYRHVLAFASTIHDVFDIETQGDDEFRDVLQRQQGALLVGAHLGSFEVLRSVGRGVGGLKVAMLMYKENARKLNATLAAINPKAMQDVIPLGRIESMLTVRDKLDDGYVVGMLADRTLGGDATQPVTFLGQPTELPVGPWRMAAMLKRPVFFMAGIYLGGNRYRIRFERLADFSQVERSQRDEAIRAAIVLYADCMTRHCRQAPYNWFNFYDFWKAR
jgi:predicted LPLAT superfamily acyltransferase